MSKSKMTAYMCVKICRENSDLASASLILPTPSGASLRLFLGPVPCFCRTRIPGHVFLPDRQTLRPGDLQGRPHPQARVFDNTIRGHGARTSLFLNLVGSESGSQKCNLRNI